MSSKQENKHTQPCGCAPRPQGSDESRAQESANQPRLEDLIPIAVVIAVGCEPCAKRAVERALRQGVPVREIQRVLATVGHLRSLDCFSSAVGPDILARMDQPLASAKMTLETLVSEGR